MGVGIEQYRAAVGLFNMRFSVIIHAAIVSISVFELILPFVVLIMLLLVSGSVHPNPGPGQRVLHLAHMNVRSFCITDRHSSKWDEICAFISSHDFDVFAVSETWLNDKVLNDQLAILGFNSPLRKDRKDSRGGGVAIFIAEHLPFVRKSEYESDEFECVWVEIALGKSKILCGAYYRPESSADLEDNFFLSLQNRLDTIKIKRYDAVVLIGDLNAHYNFGPTSTPNSRCGVKLFSFLECNGLTQLITEPTRVTESTESILDVIVTDSPEIFISRGTFSPPANCDHSVVHAKLSFPVFKPNCYKRIIRNFNGVDVNLLNNALLNADWENIENESAGGSIDVFYKKWVDLFMSIVDLFIPQKSVTIRPKDKPWMYGGIRRAMRRRDRLLKVFNRDKSSSNWTAYREQRNLVVSLIRKAKAEYNRKINSILSDPATPSKRWWQVAKSFYGSKAGTSIPPIFDNNQYFHEPKEKVEIFNEYFISQSVLPVCQPLLPVSDGNCVLLADISATESEVATVLCNLDISKACGADGISNKLLKLCQVGISRPLTHLINVSLASGKFPSEWKLANVLPLFKRDNRQLKGNYRPVSLLSALGKICEKIVFMRVYSFLESTSFFYRLQSGFRPGDSTVLQLTYIVHQIHEAIDRGNEVRTVFLDISKAFDRVWHDGLLFKLEKLGIGGVLLQWFRSYLSGRKQRVVIEGSQSSWKEIKAGVPQGSVLGPLLFLIYINDIANNLDSDCFLFADDTLLIDEVTVSPDASAAKLNRDLVRISSWADNWLVTMNASKTKSMTFSLKKDKPFHPPLSMSGKTIEVIDTHEHLGVSLSSDITWKAHISKIYQKASKKLNLLKGLKLTLSRKTLEVLYKSLVRSNLEYADIVWDGCAGGESDLLESLQFDAMRVITGAMKGTHREDLITETGLLRLSDRRKLHKLLLLYKMVNKLTPSYVSSMCPPFVSEISRYPLRISNNLHLPYVRTDKSKSAFLFSATKLWNSVPQSIRESESVPMFKNSLIREFFGRSNVNNLFYLGERYLSILHTRLRLRHCALNYYLFRINCSDSPECSCGASKEDVMHFLFFCPRFAAQRCQLFASIVQNVGDVWETLSWNRKLVLVLNGYPLLNFNQNDAIFMAVRKYIDETKRFF